MSRSYKFRDQSQPYFASFATIRWIDIFTRPYYCDILIDSLRFSIENKGLEIYGWCIMTNHVHLIMGTTGEPMQYILRDVKKFTAKRLYDAIANNPQESRKNWMVWMMEREGQFNPNNKNIQVWQQHNHPIELHSAAIFHQKLEYVHQNPVKAGIVAETHHYLYSSAFDYAGGKGPLPIVFAS